MRLLLEPVQFSTSVLQWQSSKCWSKYLIVKMNSVWFFFITVIWSYVMYVCMYVAVDVLVSQSGPKQLKGFYKMLHKTCICLIWCTHIPFQQLYNQLQFKSKSIFLFIFKPHRSINLSNKGSVNWPGSHICIFISPNVLKIAASFNSACRNYFQQCHVDTIVTPTTILQKSFDNIHNNVNVFGLLSMPVLFSPNCKSLWYVCT